MHFDYILRKFRLPSTLIFWLGVDKDAHTDNIAHNLPHTLSNFTEQYSTQIPHNSAAALGFK